MSAYSGKESDIFGGEQWTKEQQLNEELNSLGTQIFYTLSSYKKLKKSEEKALRKEIDYFVERLKSGNIYLNH